MFILVGLKGIKVYVEMFMNLLELYLNYLIIYIEIDDYLIYYYDGFIVEVYLFNYGILLYGYRVMVFEIIGIINVEVLKNIGFELGFKY